MSVRVCVCACFHLVFGLGVSRAGRVSLRVGLFSSDRKRTILSGK